MITGAAIAPSIITGSFALGSACLTGIIAWVVARTTRKGAEQQATNAHERQIAAERNRPQLEQWQAAVTAFIVAAETCRQAAVDVRYGRAQPATTQVALSNLLATRPQLVITASADVAIAAQTYVDCMGGMMSTAPDKADIRAFEKAQGQVADAMAELHNAARRDAGLPELDLVGSSVRTRSAPSV